MTNQYESPLSTRYASEYMLHLFSADMRIQTWRKLWVSLAKAEHKLGLNITEEQIRELEAHITDIDYAVAAQREKLEFLCSVTSAASSAAGTEPPATRMSAAKTWVSPAPTTAAPPPTPRRATASPAPWKAPAFSPWPISGTPIFPWASPTSSWRAAAWAAPWCWNFCCTI